MTKLDLVEVEKRFGAVTVVPELSLSIEQGEFVALVGPSGCGKSTLLRMIAGLEGISGGEIRLDGKKINDLPPQKRGMSMVFQSYALFPHLSVFENIAFGPRTRGEDLTDLNDRVERVADILDLQAHLQKRPRALSGGQRQRVAMGRAIIRSPEMFLFDEPLSNLDAKLRVAMRAEIRQLHNQLKATTIYVTHDQVEAMTMADRVAVLNAGRLEQLGAPLSLYTDPDSLFVASFIGSPSMNFIEGTFVSRQGSPGVRLASGLEIACTPRGNVVTEGQSVTLGIRPEHFLINEEGALEAKIELVETTGPETFVVLDAPDFGGTFTISVRGAYHNQTGQMLRVDPDPANTLVFDTATGARL